MHLLKEHKFLRIYCWFCLFLLLRAMENSAPCIYAKIQALFKCLQWANQESLLVNSDLPSSSSWVYPGKISKTLQALSGGGLFHCVCEGPGSVFLLNCWCWWQFLATQDYFYKLPLSVSRPVHCTKEQFSMLFSFYCEYCLLSLSWSRQKAEWRNTDLKGIYLPVFHSANYKPVRYIKKQSIFYISPSLNYSINFSCSPCIVPF